jgi:hypothetical protein
MEIESLRLSMNENDINEQLIQVLPQTPMPVVGLRIRLHSEGVVIEGAYRVMMMTVPFETIWRVEVVGSRVQAQLTELRVARFSAGMLRGMMFQQIREFIHGQHGIEVLEERIYFDPEEAMKQRGFPAKLNLRSVRFGEGTLHVEAGR